jgi:rubredoxin
VTNCPECGVNWHDGDIYWSLSKNPIYEKYSKKQILEFAQSYGWTKENGKFFSRVVGLEDHSYDGVSKWECPDCKHTWNRFVREGKEI